LINAGDEEALEAFLNDYLDRKHKFNTREIQAKSREAFSPVTIGMELCAIYDSLME
jgi:hypothetical protein